MDAVQTPRDAADPVRPVSFVNPPLVALALSVALLLVLLVAVLMGSHNEAAADDASAVVTPAATAST